MSSTPEDDEDDEADPQAARRGLMRSLAARLGFRAQRARARGGDGEHMSPAASDLMDHAQAFQRLTVADVMTPRADITAVELSSPFETVVAAFADSEHSRLPVYRETLDDPVGVAHLKDLFKLLAGPAPRDAAELVLPRMKRETLYVPPSMRAADLLVRMQASRIHMAMVIDEFGGVDGLVTLEDVIEAVVGEIDDEHDEAAAIQIVARAGGVFEVDARVDLGELETALGRRLTTEDLEEDIDTAAGLVTALAGRVPQRGEVIAHPDGLDFEITDAAAGADQPGLTFAVSAWTGDGRRPVLVGALAVFAGVAAGLAHPPFGVLPGLLGYGLMLWLADRSDPRKPLRSAFWRGWLAGCGYFAVCLHWLVYPFFVDAAEQAWMAPFAVVIVVAGIALFWGAALALYRRFAATGAWRVLLFAGMLAAFEWLRGHVLTGFPWDLPGETWAAGSAPSQAAAVVGAYGLSWITVAIFATAGVAGERGGGRVAAGVAVAALAGLYGFGAIRLAHPPAADAKAPWVRLVQPNVPQEARYDQALFEKILNQYVTLTRGPATRAPDIVVWPEGAIPAALEDYLAPGTWTAREVARAVGPSSTLVLGGYRFSGDPAKPAIAYNSLIVARTAGDNLKIEALYDKFRLVPFGEYIPLDSLAGKLGIKEMVHVGDGFASGPRPRPLTPPGVPPVQPLICYEVLFPGFTREGAAASGVRARWIANISTDAWFGPGAGPLQHFNIARYRAIEEGLPMARSTPTGVSAMIDAFGRVAKSQSLGEGASGVIDAPLPPALPPTPFSRWGDTAFWLMMLASLAGALWRRPSAVAAGVRP